MAVVEFEDEQGTMWQVFEVVRSSARPDSVRPALIDGWLCFQRADGLKLRVGKGLYPADWSTMPPEELKRISARALESENAR